MPVVRLDGTDDRLKVLDADILDDSPGISYYAVLRPSNLNGSPRGILGKRNQHQLSPHYSYSWFFWGGNTLR